MADMATRLKVADGPLCVCYLLVTVVLLVVWRYRPGGGERTLRRGGPQRRADTDELHAGPAGWVCLMLAKHSGPQETLRETAHGGTL